VLDPAQNDSFTDHYLGVPFDLSEVLFIATANFAENIPAPLLDRMEMVDFAGYTEQEKLGIARQYLLPRQLSENGLTAEQLVVEDAAMKAVISGYTREAGVRQLERELGRLARKVARDAGERTCAGLAVPGECGLEGSPDDARLAHAPVGGGRREAHIKAGRQLHREGPCRARSCHTHVPSR